MNFRKERAISALKKADFSKHAYVVIKHDKEDGYLIVDYVKIGDDLKDYIIYNPNSTYEIDEVYNLSVDINTQLNEERSYHIEPYKQIYSSGDSLIDIITSQNTNTLVNLLKCEINPHSKKYQALNYARKKHQAQTRKGERKDPYINHPIRVAYLVSELYKDSRNIENLIVASLLHDTLEDTSSSFEDLENNFGIHIAYLVKELTNNNYLKSEVGKEKYMAAKLLELSSDALKIKLCDRLDNVIDLKNADENFQEKYSNETLYILDVLKSNRKLSEKEIKIIEMITLEINNLNRKVDSFKMTYNP